MTAIEYIDESFRFSPATVNQVKLIQKLVKDFPDTKEMHEYRDYLAKPNAGNATDFISRAIEDNIGAAAGRKTYADYIATRPRAERIGSHGLFTDDGVEVKLGAVSEELNRYNGNVWTVILSLRREDAERLGFGEGKRWRELLRSETPEIAENFKIPMENLQWYAAFHNESHHPHVHGWLKDFIKIFEKFQIPTDDAALPVNLAYHCFLYGSKKVLDKADNRELTRYFDAVMNVCDDYGWQNLNQYYVFFILVALYIRKIISPTFLNADEIDKNQNNIDMKLENLPAESRKKEMPYYDYLKEFLGIDKENLPEELKHIYGLSGRNLPQYSWVFNEIIYYSMGQQFYYNEMRRFLGQPTVNSGNCHELCKLIIQYSGEQEKMTN